MVLIQICKSVVLKGALKSLAALALCVSTQLAFAAGSAAISGKVLDHAGHPVVDATVMVYHAGAATGYSLFCPSCYADCGKRTRTDHNGHFVFHHLREGLWFELLVAKSDYQPKLIAKVNPSAGKPVSTVLELRHKISEPNRIFRGQILDSHGVPQRYAVVGPVGALGHAKYETSYAFHDVLPGLDPIAITDSRGFFEIDSVSSGQSKSSSALPPLKILISIEARGMAEKFSVVPAGREYHPITVTEGAVVRGRLVESGKPVNNAEIGLFAHPHGGWGLGLEANGNPYDEIKIGTRPDGTFEIDNVPVPGTWYVYAKMESVATHGATENVQCTTKHNNEIVNLGDLELKPGYHFRGRVVLSDGRPIPNGMNVTISASETRNAQTVPLPPSGQFEFDGLAAGSYSVWASVKGYSSPPLPPVSFKAKNGHTYTYTPTAPPISIKQDINDFTITLHPNAAQSGD